MCAESPSFTSSAPTTPLPLVESPLVSSEISNHTDAKSAVTARSSSTGSRVDLLDAASLLPPPTLDLIPNRLPNGVRPPSSHTVSSNMHSANGSFLQVTAIIYPCHGCKYYA